MPSWQDKKTKLWRWRDYFDVNGDGVKVRVSAPGRFKKRTGPDGSDAAGEARIKELTEERDKRLLAGTPAAPSSAQYKNFHDFFLNKFYVSYVPNKLNSGSEQESKYTIFTNWLDKAFGAYPLAHITFDLIESVRKSWLDVGCAPKSINNRMTVLLTALKYALRLNLIDRLPQVDFHADEDTEIVIYEFEEYARFLAGAYALGSYSYAIACLAGEGNLRRGEMAELQWEDVDMVGRVVTIRRQVRAAKVLNKETGKTERKDIVSRGKSRSWRTIPMTDRLFDALNSLPAERKGLVVFHSGEGLTRKSRTAYGKRLSGKVLERVFRRICEVAGLPMPPALKKGEKREGPRLNGKLWHKLRHTWATHALQCGMDPYQVMKLMGHQDFETTKGYEHFAAAHKRPIPDIMLRAGQGVLNPNERALAMLARRGDLSGPRHLSPPTHPVVVSSSLKSSASSRSQLN